MSHWITLVTTHGRMNGWAAEPDDKPNGGIVLVHDIFGINHDMRMLANRYASEGYLTVVPSLFDKIQREIELDYTPENQRFGETVAKNLGLDIAIELIDSTADAIGHAGRIAIIGHGWGGNVALHAAHVLGLPGVNIHGLLDPLPSPVHEPMQLHHGDADPRFHEEMLRVHHEAYPAMEIYTYPAGPNFSREGDTGHWHAPSAELAFERTRNLLHTHIRHEND